MSRNETDEKIRFLKGLSYRIHRKEAPADALNDCIEAEGRGGKHRQWRQAVQVLEDDGFAPALLAGGLIGPDVAAVLAVVEKSKDHRLLSDALDSLVELLEQG